jgi:capsular polysaccharide transport system permease protein
VNQARKKRQLWKSAFFMITVVLPTVAAVAYFGFYASSIYVTESKFVIRSPQKLGASSFMDMFSKLGMSKSDEDSFAVREFILSRDAMKVLNQDLKIKDAYSDPAIDAIERFPGWRYWDSSLEAFYRYYQKHVGVEVDSGSSIATLSVKAFSPEQALSINQKLIEMSEAFVNKLNERARLDLLKSATDEVNIAKAKVENTTLALMQVRTQKADQQPDKQVMAQQRIALEKTFAEQQLATAMTALEQSRIEAIRKQVYIERITQPVKPDYPVLPERLKGIVTTFVLSLVFWGILMLLIAGVKEHHV